MVAGQVVITTRELTLAPVEDTLPAGTRGIVAECWRAHSAISVGGRVIVVENDDIA